jgi:hypothetical protein
MTPTELISWRNDRRETMSNETISYQDFVDRVDEEFPMTDPANWFFRKHSFAVRDEIIVNAWEECAWISTLTTDRLRRALENAAKAWS